MWPDSSPSGVSLDLAGSPALGRSGVENAFGEPGVPPAGGEAPALLPCGPSANLTPLRSLGRSSVWTKPVGARLLDERDPQDSSTPASMLASAGAKVSLRSSTGSAAGTFPACTKPVWARPFNGLDAPAGAVLAASTSARSPKRSPHGAAGSPGSRFSS